MISPVFTSPSFIFLMAFAEGTLRYIILVSDVSPDANGPKDSD